MSRKRIIGIMGAGEGASAADMQIAEELGELVARQSWVVLTGGRDVGVMQAAARGAKRVAGSLVVGIVPSESGPVSPDVDIPIFTGLSIARNAINALSSDVLVACGTGGAGTASEVVLALKSGRPVVLVAPTAEARSFFTALNATVRVVSTPEEAVDRIEELLSPGLDDGANARQSVGLVALVVRDYDEAIAFFTGTLGFTLVEDTAVPEQQKRWVVVAPPNAQESRLLLARAATDEQMSRVGNQTGGRVFLFLRTDDFWRDYNAYRARGVVFVRAPKEEPYGTVAVFQDLYGNLWDLYQPRQ